MQTKLHFINYRLSALLFTLFICGQLCGQIPSSIDNLRTVMPPSPNSSAFAEYGNWPVSLYTGVPNINIPITTLKGRTVNVPISLSYHASGNRVGDIASWVGLGWSLNAGGVISRSIRGLNDDNNLFLSSSYYSNPNDMSSTVTPTSLDSSRIFGTAQGSVDSEEDTYNFSALGKSYRLLVMANGTVYTIPRSNLSFVSNPIVGAAGGSPGAGWTVLLEDGTKLVFGSTQSFVETTNNPGFTTPDGKGIEFTSSWLLQSITSTTGETINFTYTSSTVEQDSYFSQSDNIKCKTSYTSFDVSGASTCQLVTNSLATTSRSSIQSVVTLYLSSIESDLERVTFKTDTGRSDLYGGVVLTELQAFSKLNGKYIETEDYVFNTGYSQAVSSNELLIGTTHNPNYFRSRLRLNSLQRKDIQNLSPPQTWSFNYNAQNLPSRRSFAQDHWGYFNGATTNTTLLPPEYYQLPNSNPEVSNYLSTTGFIPNYHDLGGTRDGNGTYMQAEMLTQVNYPTGGYSQFAYEPNSYQATQETFTSTQVNFNLNLAYGQSTFTTSQTATIQLTTPSYIGVNPFVCNIGNFDRGNISVTVSVLDGSGNIVGSASFLGTQGSSTSQTGSFWFNIIHAGTYTLSLSTNLQGSDFTDPTNSINASAVFVYPQSNGVQNVNLLSGGLRVTSIIDYDGVTGAYNSKYYQYANPLVINSVDPVNDYLTIQTSSSYNATSGEKCFFTNAIRNSATKYVSGLIQGGTTGYGQVTTLYGTGGVNGSTVSIFNSVPDHVIDSTKYGPHIFPYPAADSRDDRRGLLLTQKDYNASEVLLKQIDHTYSFNTVGSFVGLKAGYSNLVDPALCYDVYGLCGASLAFYSTTAEQVKHLTAKETDYDNNGQNPMVSSTSYYYDSPSNTQPDHTVMVDSRGDSIKVYSKTALELNNSALINQNMVSQVLQSIKYNNSSLLSTETFNYSSSGLILPQNVQEQKGSGPSYTSLTINNYDAHGNVIQLTPLDGVNKNYIWDYNATRPIAEVTNASLTGIAFTSFEADGSGNWSISANWVADTTTSFTGKSSLPLASRSLSFSGLNSSNSYIISLWAKGSTASISVNGTAISGGNTRNGWTYYQTAITGHTTVTITGSGNIDDVRLYPTGATMTTYTYGPYGVTSITDANNVSMFYQYDGIGRLVTTTDAQGKILKTYRYHYKQ